MSSAQRVTFGQLLRRYRLAARLTQEQLAAVAGIGVRSIGDLERDVSRAPHAETLRLLADALGLTGAARNAFEAAGRRITAKDVDQTRSTAFPDLPSFVGRAEELALIARLLQGEIAPLLLFSGEPGIGKSRLLAEAATHASAQGWRVLAGGCTRRSGQAPYEPLVSALVRETRRTPAARLRLELQGCGWLVRLLPELLEARVVPAPTWTLPPEQERRLLFDAVARYLANVAGPSGTLLLLDDLQWADGDALALLERLVTEAAGEGAGSEGGASLRLLGAYRATEVRLEDPLGLLIADLAQQGLAMRRHLPPLSHDEASALLIQLWPEQPKDQREGQQKNQRSRVQVAREETLRRAEGLPFYLVSTARAFQEAAQDEGQDHGEMYDATTSGGPIPASVAESVQARVAALPAAARRLIEVAAVAGRIVAGGLLLVVTPRPEEETLEALEALVHAGLLAEDDAGTYRFTHDLIRETVEAMLGSQRRRTLHRRLAEELERQDDQDDHARHTAEIAAHFLAAGELRRALPAVLLAGDQVESVYAHIEAEGHYHAALELAEELRDQPREAEALEKLGRTVTLLGRHREAAAFFDQALRVYQELSDQLGELRALAGWLKAVAEVGREQLDAAVGRARAILARIEPANTSLTPLLGSALAAAHTHLGWMLWVSGIYEDAQTEQRQAVELARASGDEAELAQAQFLLLASGGREPTAQAFEETLALAERSGRTNVVVTSHNMAAVMYTEQGDFARAMAHMEQALAVAEQRQDPRHLAWQLKNFSRFLFDAGDWRRMREVFARADAMMREADRDYGETWQSADMSIHRGIYALAEGREEEGWRLLDEAMKRIAQMGPISRLHFPTCMLAEADLLAGHPEDARRRLTTLLSDRQTFTPDEHSSRGARLLFAWAEMALGRHEAAEALLSALLLSAPPFFRVDALRIQGLLAMAQQRWEMGVAALDKALELTRSMPYPYAELKALWVYGRLEAARGNTFTAEERFRAALAICGRLGEGWYRRTIEDDLQPFLGGTSR
jgi:tetratricopeptide (TPR) repeat protein/transcriptional regulator with XRE-family HTH domain